MRVHTERREPCTPGERKRDKGDHHEQENEPPTASFDVASLSRSELPFPNVHSQQRISRARQTFSDVRIEIDRFAAPGTRVLRFRKLQAHRAPAVIAAINQHERSLTNGREVGAPIALK
jgi:hypothetical protein